MDNACIIGNRKKRLWVNIIGGKGKVNLKEKSDEGGYIK